MTSLPRSRPGLTCASSPLVARTLGAVLCGYALLLGGCMHATRNAQVHHYDLGTPAASSTQPESAHGNFVLRIAHITVPPWLDGNAMHYRLAYQGSDRLAAYAYSNWASPPASLLESVIQRSLADGGAWRAVLGPGNPAPADRALRIKVDDFSQVFSRPDQSAGIIDATATLVDGRDGHVIAQRHFHVAVPAPIPDAPGGVKALSTAARQFARALQTWINPAQAPVNQAQAR